MVCSSNDLSLQRTTYTCSRITCVVYRKQAVSPNVTLIIVVCLKPQPLHFCKVFAKLFVLSNNSSYMIFVKETVSKWLPFRNARNCLLVVYMFLPNTYIPTLIMYNPDYIWTNNYVYVEFGDAYVLIVL